MVVVAAMTLMACSGSDEAGQPQVDATVTTESPLTTTMTTTTTTVPPTTVPDAGSGQEPDPSTGAETDVDVGSGGEVDGSDAELPSPLTIVGVHRPSISWEAVDGAIAYRLLIITDDATWAWEGSDTMLVVGGGEEIDRLGPGFELTGPAEVWWQAVGVDDVVLASTISSAPGP